MSPWLQCEDEWIGGRVDAGIPVLAGFAKGRVRLMEAGPGAVGGE